MSRLVAILLVLVLSLLALSLVVTIAVDLGIVHHRDGRLVTVVCVRDADSSKTTCASVPVRVRP